MSQKIVQCRYCDYQNCPMILDLGEQALANSFLKQAQTIDSFVETKFPLDIYYCDNCGLVQIATIVDPKTLFKDYIYFSSTSEAIHTHGKYLANKFADNFGLTSNSLVVEIASNDGTILKYFQDKNIKVLGVEPAENIAKVAIENGIETYVNFFDEENAKILKKKYGRAKIILARNVFAHIPYIHGFVKGLKYFLDDDGVIAIEAPHLLELIKNTQFDTIYHEHVTYLSLRAMKNLFNRYDLSVFDVEFSELNGGSLIYYICHKTSLMNSPTPKVKYYVEMEHNAGLYDIKTYYDFAKRTEEIKDELLRIVKEIKSEGKTIAGYGASAKGMVLLMYTGLNSDTIDFIVDKSEAKQGYYTPGSHIPVLPTNILHTKMPDYTILFAWNLAEEIIKQQSKYLELGGKFIVPIPYPSIVEKK